MPATDRQDDETLTRNALFPRIAALAEILTVLIAGNLIGLAADGNSVLGNVHGVSVHGGASNTIIGGDTANERNVISGNTETGIRIGDAATSGTNVTITGNYTETASSVFQVDLSGAACDTFDTLTVNGTATLLGTLDIELVDGCTPSAPAEWVILNAPGGLSNMLSLEVSPPPGNWNIATMGNTVVLQFL